MVEYKFIEDREIIEFAEKYLHLSYSTEKEVGEFFKELKNIKNIDFLEFIKEMEIELNNNRKHVKVRVKATFDYLNVPKFMYEYDKTIMGSTLRTMAFPGWGQFYNNTYVTGFLYAFLFSFFCFCFF